ncbi:MAG: ABC transporter ATP-binding protein [Verrucomicrobiaceae bacterium]
MIRAENIGKRYVLNHQTGGAGQYRKFSDVLVHAAKAPLRLFQKEKVESGKQKGTEDFWALKDINFEIKRGEVVGIIGRNGAGKSTLLKILSRITEPTTGRITLRGRVASLLEVGTGFHPELTGRENIYLNGAILGMTKAEIHTKFDEIVAFAEIDKFLDTPVKRYSSGMYVRLAFAVAAHLEPEILIVDEVLAVGDAQFQKKCLGKMNDVAAGGRTVLFVSHQMGMVQSLCTRAIRLVQGSVHNDGKPAQVIETHMLSGTENQEFVRVIQSHAEVQFLSGRLAEDNRSEGLLHVDLLIHADKRRAVSLDVRVLDASGTPVGYGSLGTLDESKRLRLLAGTNAIAFTLDTKILANGNYFLSLDVSEPFVRYYDHADNCLSFHLDNAPQNGRTRVLVQSWGKGSCELSICETSAAPCWTPSLPIV